MREFQVSGNISLQMDKNFILWFVLYLRSVKTLERIIKRKINRPKGMPKFF